MYAVKDAGRDGYARYSRGGRSALEQISTAGRLRKSIESGRGLALHYQPLMNLETAEVVGVEALVRWQDGSRGLVQPDELIPLAEQVGLIGLLSDCVVAEACRQAAACQRDGMDFYVSINVPPSYCQPTGMAHLATAANDAGIDLGKLMIEVTESALAPDKRGNLEDTLSDMREQGLRLAIDDFGTGHSSLGRLNQTWVNMLKIDRSFVMELGESEQARNLVSSIVQLANRLDLEPLAEGVETEEHRRFLVHHGCRYGRGFLFSRPLATDEIKPFYNREHRSSQT
jgi:diguanylate cyclase